MKIIYIVIAFLLILTMVSCQKIADNETDNTESSLTDNNSDSKENSENTFLISDKDSTEPQSLTSDTEPINSTDDTSSDTVENIYSDNYLESLDNTKSGYGQGINVDNMNRPTGAAILQKKHSEYGAVFIEPENSGICLTFDLGYEFGCTEKILDTLNEKGIKGVFFVTMPYVKGNPELIRRMVNEGHVVGNHSVNHKSMPSLSIDEMKNEIMELHNYIKDNFGYEMWLFRPPMGEFSPRSVATAKSLGYTSVFWSYAYYDYDTANQPDVNEAYTKVTNAVHNGAVYLLHGVSETNTAILGNVIDYFKEKGYSFQTLEQYK